MPATNKQTVKEKKSDFGGFKEERGKGKWTFSDEMDEPGLDDPNVQRVIKICGI